MKLNEAKNFFFMCNGNSFVMEREGKYKEFLALGIPKETLNSWLMELKHQYETIISQGVEVTIVMDAIYKYGELNIPDNKRFIWDYFIDNIARFDDFTRLLLCEVFCSKPFQNWIRENNIIEELENQLGFLAIKNKGDFNIDESYIGWNYLSKEDFEKQNLNDRIEMSLSSLRGVSPPIKERKKKKSFWANFFKRIFSTKD